MPSSILWRGRQVGLGASAHFQAADGATHSGVVYAETVGDFPHGVDTGLEGESHGLASAGVAAGEVDERPALGAWRFAQPLREPGWSAVALHERLTAEKDPMAQPFPDARLLAALADEGGVTGLCAGLLLGEPTRPTSPWRRWVVWV